MRYHIHPLTLLLSRPAISPNLYAGRRLTSQVIEEPMNVRDILKWVLGRDGTPNNPEIEVDRDRVRRLAADATDEHVTESLLANDDDFTHHPPITYLDEDEQPEYALLGGRVWIGEDLTYRADEVPSKRTVVLVTDKRILLIVGKRLKDSLWQIPFEGLTFANIKYDESEAYLDVDADYEDAPQSFFVELLPGDDGDRYAEIVNYCNERAGGEGRSDEDGGG